MERRIIMFSNTALLPDATVKLLRKAELLADFQRRREATVSAEKFLGTLPEGWTQGQKETAVRIALAQFDVKIK
jgi:hypothetical protein